MGKTLRLVFCGELLPGRSPDEVKAGLPALMKIPPAQVEKLFSGQPVVIKRGLPEAQLMAYQALLEKAGLRVRVEDEDPFAGLSLAPLSPPAEEPVAGVCSAAVEPQLEEMVCPKCGFRQPKRVLCRECGVDMPRYVVAQQAETANPGAGAAPSPYVASATATLSHGFSAVQEDLPPVFEFNLQGRLNRVRYLVYGVVMQAMMVFAAFMAVGSIFTAMFGGGSFPFVLVIVFLLLALVMMFFGIRFSVQRLHDMGYTGWLVLLIFVPFIGWIAGIWFMLWPGTQGENEYGLPNPPNSSLHYVILVGAFAVILAVSGLMIRKMVSYSHGMRQMQSTPYGKGMTSHYQPSEYDQPFKPRR